MSAEIKRVDRSLSGTATAMGFSLVLFLLAVFGLNAQVIIQLEHQILSAVAGASHPWLDVFFNWTTLLGDFNVLCPVVVVSALVLLYKHQFEIASVLCVGFFGAALSTLLLKTVFDRPRPDLFDSALQYLPVNAAFPSGHTTHATAIALFLIWLAYRRRRYFLSVAASIIATLVAISRLYLQVHWPTDVLGGVAVSLFWVSFATLINDLFRKKYGQNG